MCVTCLIDVLLGWCNTHMFQISRDVPGLEGLPHVKKSIDGVEQQNREFQNGAVQTCLLLVQGVRANMCRMTLRNGETKDQRGTR